MKQSKFQIIENLYSTIEIKNTIADSIQKNITTSHNSSKKDAVPHYIEHTTLAHIERQTFPSIVSAPQSNRS